MINSRTKYPVLSAKLYSEIEISIYSNSTVMEIKQWEDIDTSIIIYKSLNADKKYKFALPKEKGEYIFEVSGYWNDEHNT